MRKFSMPLTALAAVAFAGAFHPADLDATQVQQQQQAQERAQQQAADSVEGTIASRENGTFVVMTRQGERMSFHTNDQTQVEDRQNRGLQALDSGESVLVHYRAIATRVQPRDGQQEVDPQERQRTERERQQQMEPGQQENQATDSIQGTLAQRENGAFTVVTERGERKTFHLEEQDARVEEREQAQVRQQVDLDQLQEGQEITVHFRAVATNIEVRDDAQDPYAQQQEREEREQAQQQRQQRQQQQQQEQERQQQAQQRQQQLAETLQGTVAQRENGTFVITTSEGERISLQTNDQTRVGVWQERNLDALSEGESIVVEYRAIATKVEPRDDQQEMDPQERERMERERMERERQQQMEPGQQHDQATDSIQGTLAQRENGAFTVVTERGERKTFHLDDQRRQTEQPERAQAQQEVDLDQLQEGQDVTVHYRIVAQRIEVRQDGQARQERDPQQERQQDERQERQPPMQRQDRDRQEATDSIEGTVAERENGAFVILTSTGERMSFDIDAETRVGDRTEQNVEELRSGESVVVEYRAIATKVEPADDARETDPQERERTERERMERMEQMERDHHDQATDSIRGTLAQRENGAFTVVTERGERKTFHLEDRQMQQQDRRMEQREQQAQVQQQVDLDQFEEGQELIVHFRAVATNIEQRGDGGPR